MKSNATRIDSSDSSRCGNDHSFRRMLAQVFQEGCFPRTGFSCQKDIGGSTFHQSE
jgi:hypothetical protein